MTIIGFSLVIKMITVTIERGKTNLFILLLANSDCWTTSSNINPAVACLQKSFFKKGMFETFALIYYIHYKALIKIIEIRCVSRIKLNIPSYELGNIKLEFNITPIKKTAYFFYRYPIKQGPFPIIFVVSGEIVSYVFRIYLVDGYFHIVLF